MLDGLTVSGRKSHKNNGARARFGDEFHVQIVSSGRDALRQRAILYSHPGQQFFCLAYAIVHLDHCAVISVSLHLQEVHGQHVSRSRENVLKYRNSPGVKFNFNLHKH